jgi:hypothetical protein
MWLEDHFGNSSSLQRNERVKLAASFWNNIGAGMVIGGIAAAFFLDKPEGSETPVQYTHLVFTKSENGSSAKSFVRVCPNRPRKRSCAI